MDAIESTDKHEQRSAIAEAIERIRDIGKGNKLDGEDIKDWIHAGHKY